MRLLVSTRRPQDLEKRPPDSLRDIYQSWLEKKSIEAHDADADKPRIQFMKLADMKNELKERGIQGASPLGNVAIIGAGMAGLTAALQLLCTGNYRANVTIIEADSRAGGRLFTHYFPSSPEVYCEIGGMRLPSTHKRVAMLIKWLKDTQGKTLDLIPFHMSDPEGRNRVCVNGRLVTAVEAKKNPSCLGFGARNDAAGDLLDSVLGPFVKELKDAAAVSEQELQKKFEALVNEYDDYSFERYLREVEKWDAGTINYVETMTDQTNAFKVSFIEQLMDAYEFDGRDGVEWQTIQGGMQRLPAACLEVLEQKGACIMFNSRVIQLDNLETGQVKVEWRDYNGSVQSKPFDKVLLALPPVAVRMIKTPQWSVEKEHALRALRYDPIRKIGLKFKTRWWEQLKSNPVQGGQSITDLPSRWIVYPSNDIDGKGEGALLCYCWTSDAYAHLTLSKEEQVAIAMRDLKTVHPEPVVLKDGRVADLDDLFLEGFPFEWSQSWAGGIAFFFPGQWKTHYAAAVMPENNAKGLPAIFFAGEHLSMHHAWVEGALESAEKAVCQMGADNCGKPVTDIESRAQEAAGLQTVLMDMPFRIAG